MRAAGVRTGVVVTAGLLLAGGLSACASDGGNRPTDVLNAIQARDKASGVVAAPAAAPAATSPCKSPYKPEASYDPLPSVPGTLPAGSLEATIRNRGFMVVGVSGDTRLLGARDKLTDEAPAGFDISVARAIGEAILGPNADVRYKVITAGQRFSQVNTGFDAAAKKDGVDLVARAVSMTCDRWATADPSLGSAFSAAYLTSDQRVLVRTGTASLDALVKARKAAGSTARVCAPAGSTSLTNIQGMDGVTAVPVAIHSDCLALWQEGRVDAITGDDVILAGFQVQDPTAVILGGKTLAQTPYGLAISRAHPEFVRYVNAVMATSEFRSAWTAAYQAYLAGPLVHSAKSFPAPVYGRPVAG